MAISDEKFVSLTTYKRDGSTKSLPVWIADFGDGKVGFTTASSTYKVKRLANDPRVVLQPSDRRGRVTDGSTPVTGTAEVLTGDDFTPYEAIMKSKYGVQFHAAKLAGSFMRLIGKGSGTDSAVVITLD